MNHPDLSDDINSKITKSEIDGGVWLQMPEESASIAHAEAKAKGNVLPVGKGLKVQTKNTLYFIERRGENEFWISGNQRLCPVPVHANIHGSTWGTSMLKMGYVGREMHLEFSLVGEYSTITTTPITEITEVSL